MTLLLRVRRAFCALHLLLGEAFTQPVLENGAFRKSYVQTERDTVRKKLESIVNDKIRYARSAASRLCARTNRIGRIR